MSHINIPVFVPHIGCPHDCAFCNQHIITGNKTFDFSSVEKTILASLSTVDKNKDEVEIAFFGGSFTGIERPLMIHLLDVAQKYVRSGDISSIRLSTRPDYISDEILDLLSEYSVRTVELGIQSVSDSVLFASARGHTFADTEKAVKAVVNHGFDLVGQMMIGLPLSDDEDEIKTAEFICKCGAVASRIYPTVVFANTALEHMMKSGKYNAITPIEAAKRAAKIYAVFVKNNIKVLRIGLCESDGLHGDVVGGAYHPSIGEMCLSEYYYDLTASKLEDIKTKNRHILIFVNPKRISTAIGNGGSMRARLYKEYSPYKISYKSDCSLKENEVKIIIKEPYQCD